jgi:hypothetical protein
MHLYCLSSEPCICLLWRRYYFGLCQHQRVLLELDLSWCFCAHLRTTRLGTACSALSQYGVVHLVLIHLIFLWNYGLVLSPRLSRSIVIELLITLHISDLVNHLIRRLACVILFWKTDWNIYIYTTMWFKALVSVIIRNHLISQIHELVVHWILTVTSVLIRELSISNCVVWQALAASCLIWVDKMLWRFK